MELLNHKILGDGQPLIILHGFLGSLDNWLTLGKRFSENFQVHLLDQRNHGKSFHSDQWGYDEMVEDLENYISHFELKDPILLGHSMGGKTVMQFAAYHQNDIDKLIVADIGSKYYPVHHEKILEGLKFVPVSEVKSREEVDRILQKHIPDLGTRTFLMKNLARSSEGFSWKMNLDVLDRNIEQIGKEVNYHLPVECDTLFLRGGNSNYILDEDWNSIQEIFPNSELTTVENSGHWLHADRPDQFYDLVIKFLL